MPPTKRHALPGPPRCLDDLDALLVYADALQERGDPRGALIALQQPEAGDGPHSHAMEADELLRRERRALLGARLAAITTDGHRSTCRSLAWRWSLGFIAAAVLEQHKRSLFGSASMLRLLLESPASALLDHLTVRGLRGDESYAPLLAQLAARRLPSLRELLIGAARPRRGLPLLGPLDPLVHALPSLTTLGLIGRGAQLERPLTHPTLRVLTLRVPMLAPGIGATLGASRLPSLVALDLRWPRLALDAAGLRWLPVGETRRLRELRLGARLDGEALAALLDHKAFESLAYLDLTPAYLTPDCWRALEQRASRLAALEQLGLPPTVDPAIIDRLRARCPALQLDSDPLAPPAPAAPPAAELVDDDSRELTQLPLFSVR
jgi:hypothetical protein